MSLVQTIKVKRAQAERLIAEARKMMSEADELNTEIERLEREARLAGVGQMKQARAKLLAGARQMLEGALSEKRLFTPAERARWEEMKAEAAALKTSIDRVEQQEFAEERAQGRTRVVTFFSNEEAWNEMAVEVAVEQLRIDRLERQKDHQRQLAEHGRVMYREVDESVQTRIARTVGVD